MVGLQAEWEAEAWGSYRHTVTQMVGPLAGTPGASAGPIFIFEFDTDLKFSFLILESCSPLLLQYASVNLMDDNFGFHHGEYHVGTPTRT